VLRPGSLKDDRWSALRCLVTRRRFLGLLGVAGLGAYAGARAGALAGALADALAPASTVPDNFYVRTAESLQPIFDRDTYRLVVDGLVRRPLSFAYGQLLRLPSERQTCDFRCIEGWGVDDVPWEGIQLRTLLRMTRPLADARFVTFHCLGETYEESLSLEQAELSHALLAYCMYGHPLPPEHGSPLRLVFPRMLGYKSAKWVTRLEFRAERDRGYWERLGAPVDPWVEDPDPCSAGGFGGCRSCRLEAWLDEWKRRRAAAIPTPGRAPLTAGTAQAGLDSTGAP
jgi:DMSO/TMAO reductase YedYZ molybdopterin-dependent catalytic subunit